MILIVIDSRNSSTRLVRSDQNPETCKPLTGLTFVQHTLDFRKSTHFELSFNGDMYLPIPRISTVGGGLAGEERQ